MAGKIEARWAPREGSYLYGPVQPRASRCWIEQLDPLFFLVHWQIWTGAEWRLDHAVISNLGEAMKLYELHRFYGWRGGESGTLTRRPHDDRE